MQLRNTVRHLVSKPQNAYVCIALIFGLLYIVILPPMMAPDEGAHYIRSYQVAELDILKLRQEIPGSHILFDSLSWLNPDKKTSVSQILALRHIQLSPEKVVKAGTTDNVIPYIPQALGMFIGRIFCLPELFLVYLGRLMNLLASVLMVYYAIKIIPMMKWSMFLLALMPMTVHQFGSLSYDGVTIGMSFLMVAFILKLAVTNTGRIPKGDLVKLFILVLLLAQCKVPYGLLVFLFLLIPLCRIGSLKKYLLVFIMMLVAVFSGMQIFYLLRSMFSARETLLTLELLDPHPQIEFIRANAVNYAEIVMRTIFIDKRYFYLASFVGHLGWLDIALPAMLIKFSFLLLVFSAMYFSPDHIHLGWRKKGLIFVVLLVGVLLIETALYLYWTKPGNPVVEGVQGRYFIPLAPLFLLLLHRINHRTVIQYIKNLMHSDIPGKVSDEKPGKLSYLHHGLISTETVIVFILLYMMFFLSVGLSAILHRYYF